MFIESDSENYIVGDDKKIVHVHQQGFDIALEFIRNNTILRREQYIIPLVRMIRELYNLGLYDAKKCSDAAHVYYNTKK